MGSIALTLVVGFVSGVLSGAFGIGGGLVTTPAIRLLLGFPELVAVGTPLPVILPGALTGAVTHARYGTADVRAGVVMGSAGVLTSVAGAYLSRLAGGVTVMLATSALILWAATDIVLQQRDASRAEARAAALPGEEEADPYAALTPAPGPGARPSWLRLAALGTVAGLYSGFLGLGGGFVIVPGLTRFCGFSVKRAIGTSLVTVAVLAVPGTITHALLGHIDWALAATMAIGVVPGALLGARFTRGASERHIRLAFAVMLAVVGVWLAVSEIAGIR
jgi:uncharacterized protein